MPKPNFRIDEKPKPNFEREPFSYEELIDLQASLKKLATAELLNDTVTQDICDAHDAVVELVLIKAKEKSDASNKI